MQAFLMRRTRRHAPPPARAALAVLALAAALPQAARAQVVVYSNVTTTVFSAVRATGLPDGTLRTPTFADDINAAPGYAGRQVTQLSFAVYNADPAAATFTPTVSFYNANGTGGAPGTLLAAVSFSPITLAAFTPGLFTQSSPGGFFALPSGTFWAGLSFSGPPAAQLNSLAHVFYNPPTVGTSQDRYFRGTDSGPATSNPSGFISSNNGSPVSNFGWAFTVAGAPAPEPPPSAVLALGALGLGVRAWRAPPPRRLTRCPLSA